MKGDAENAPGKSAIAVIDLGDFGQGGCDRYGHSPFGLRQLGRMPLFQRMARRLSECTLVKKIYLVGSNIPTWVMTSGIAGIECCSMGTAHMAERVGAAMDASDADWAVYVPANRPFVDADLVDRLLAIAFESNCDCVGYRSSTDPCPSQIGLSLAGSSEWQHCDRVEDLGLTGEVVHSDAVRRLRRNTDRIPISARANFMDILGVSPGVFHLKLVPLPSNLDRCDLRFSVDGESDWDRAQMLCETMGDDSTEWQSLTELVQFNSSLCDEMARENQSTA